MIRLPAAFGAVTLFAWGVLPSPAYAETASCHGAGGSVVEAGQFAGLAVPAFCRVSGVASAGPGSSVAFEVWVPRDGWNGKLEVVGNGGYAGAIGYRDMAAALARGYAVAGGDSGHQGPDGDLGFAVGHPARLADWGYRSVHLVLGAARPVVAAATGRDPERAYYVGCSTGGGQGLAEAQRYPDDFDGLVIGAPGNNRTRLNAFFIWMYAANHPGGVEAIPAAKLPAITAAATAACDRQRGVSDGFYDPAACTFDPGTLLCAGAENASCLTPAQLAALRAMYAGPVDPRTGARIFAGANLGAESGWAGYIDGPEPARTEFWRFWVRDDPAWRWQDFDFDRDVTEADALVGPDVNNTNPDLSAFKAHGGRIIEYHGGSDPVAPRATRWPTTAPSWRGRARVLLPIRSSACSWRRGSDIAAAAPGPTCSATAAPFRPGSIPTTTSWPRWTGGWARGRRRTRSSQ